MPRVRTVVGLVEENDSYYELRRNNRNTCADGNPGEYIRNPTAVALRFFESVSVSFTRVKQLTKARLVDLGARMEVQWYCPPAVG